MSGQTECKVCGKSFSRLAVHLRTKHKMTMAEYEGQYGIENEFLTGDEELEATDDYNESSNLLLSEFLSEYKMSEEALRRILDNRMRRGIPKTESQVMSKLSKTQESATRQAEKLKDKDEVKTTEVVVAELLTTNYGFTCVSVIGAKNGEPKYWHLKR